MAEASTPHVSVKPTPPVSGPLATLEAWLYDMLVVKAPFQLPKELTNFIVQYGPWITLVIAVLMLPAVLAVLGLSAFVGSLGAYYGANIGLFYWLSIVALVIQIAIMLISVPMLLKRQRQGWLLIFYADIASFTYSLLGSLSSPYSMVGGVLGALISVVIGMYILFQIRSYYVK